MKALLYTKPYTFEYTDVPDPAVGDDDILVRVKACGICGSDVAGHTGKTGRRLPPLIMGHEAAGVVERTGRNVRGFAPGRPHLLRLDRLLQPVSRVQAGPVQPLRQAAGAGRLRAGVQAAGGLRRVRRGPALDLRQAAGEHVVRPGGAAGAGLHRHARGQSPADRQDRHRRRHRRRHDRPVHSPGGQAPRGARRPSPATSTSSGSIWPGRSAPTCASIPARST